MNRLPCILTCLGLLSLSTPIQAASEKEKKEEKEALKACAQAVLSGIRKVADVRDSRFLGKVQEETAVCRGGQRALQFRNTPWVDWSNYWGTGDMSTKLPGLILKDAPSKRGVRGALLDLEFQRIELIKFNLFENSGTYKEYIVGRDGVGGPALKRWDAMRLPSSSPFYAAVGGDGQQACKGDLIRARTLTGVCNDVLNPAMGSAGQLFARNVEFETTFPDLSNDQLARNRHGDRLGLLKPDPQVISRKLFTRPQSNPDACREGFGMPGMPADANCDYKKAPFFNVLAAYWIQFMTHDWFSHMDEGHNANEYMKVGCESQKVNGVETPLSEEDAKRLGCRPDDRVDKGFVANGAPPEKFTNGGREYMTRAPKVMANNSTAWWDASQIYGYDERSQKRVKRDPSDRAKLLLVSAGGKPGYLPVFDANDPISPQWTGQETAAFPDNWTIGLSFLHTVFTREHNAFVDEFRKLAAKKPNDDSGLRNPADPKKKIAYKDVTPDELYECARLVVAAEIAKIHTTEWTPQLLYDEPLYLAMNANWSGLLGNSGSEVSKVLNEIVTKNFGKSDNVKKATSWYSVFASGPGIFGLGSKAKGYDMTKPEFLNGGVNHFGSPFNFPEEFVTVYRLHPLLPDLIEYRELDKDPNKIASKIPIIETFEAKATPMMDERGAANWGISLGRQRLGLLTLQNHPQFLQNITLSRLDSPTKKLDLAALDLIRDREHGVPRFNEFRRQYGLRQLTSFDDFADPHLAADSSQKAEQLKMTALLREVYGQHVCDASKVITSAQKNDDGTPINDCLGKPNGSTVDNIEDVDTVVGWLAEYTRPHGYAISETQFVVFILNASRRLFSDRFFTSSFRPEFYTTFGVDWVNRNGPGGEVMEKGEPNGHKQPVSPFKRVLLRTVPELAPELANVVNTFDPWNRERSEYYSLEWKPRPGAEQDPAFTKP
ncbi:MAG: peroxidase family protein [Paludibaculum sp.]